MKKILPFGILMLSAFLLTGCFSTWAGSDQNGEFVWGQVPSTRFYVSLAIYSVFPLLWFILAKRDIEYREGCLPYLWAFFAVPIILLILLNGLIFREAFVIGQQNIVHKYYEGWPVIRFFNEKTERIMWEDIVDCKYVEEDERGEVQRKTGRWIAGDIIKKFEVIDKQGAKMTFILSREHFDSSGAYYFGYWIMSWLFDAGYSTFDIPIEQTNLLRTRIFENLPDDLKQSNEFYPACTSFSQGADWKVCPPCKSLVDDKAESD
jgi:hypothetical protein